MNKFNIIDKRELREFKEYFQSRCINIVLDISEKRTNLHFQRGKYKGYLYAINVTNYLLKQNKNIQRYELYNHFKNQKNNILNKYITNQDFQNGIKNSLFDILNYISIK